MRIETIAKNYQVSDKLEEIIQKKVNKLDKYFNDDTKCKVYLKKENKSHKMEVSLDYKGNLVRAQAYGENFYDTLDIILPKIENQIYKHRSKLEARLKKNAYKDERVFEGEETRPIELVKIKKFELKPMSVAEALEEFELMGHTFYVFSDKDSGVTKVLYLRDDGDVGMIEPAD